MDKYAFIFKYLSAIMGLLCGLFLIGKVYASEQACIIGYANNDITLTSKEHNLNSPIKLILRPSLESSNKPLDIYDTINSFFYTSVFNNPTLKVCDKVYLTKYISSYIRLDTKLWQDFVLNAYNIIRDHGVLNIPLVNSKKINALNHGLLESLFQQKIANRDSENKPLLQLVKNQDIPYKHSTMQFSTHFGLHILFLLGLSNSNMPSDFASGISDLGYMESNSSG